MLDLNKPIDLLELFSIGFDRSKDIFIDYAERRILSIINRAKRKGWNGKSLVYMFSIN